MNNFRYINTLEYGDDVCGYTLENENKEHAYRKYIP